MIRVGTDIVSIDRIDRSLQRFGKKFLDRLLQPAEYSPETKTASIAGYWAAKEAIAKALGCGIGSELSFHDILLQHDEKGAPFFTLSDEASQRFHVRESSLSISHDGGFAIAVVVLSVENE